VPGAKGKSGSEAAGKQAAFEKASSVSNSFGSTCKKFDFPNLKVGTLDTLMLLSDELDKYDKHADIAIRRIVRSWTNDVSGDGSVGEEETTVDQLKVDMGGGDVDAFQGLQSFHWQEERFPHKTNLPELAATIHRQICELDDEVKENLGKFAQLRNAINALKRKSGGNLLVKDLNGIVDQKCYVQKVNESGQVIGDISEKIVPVFVVVPKQRKDDFDATYESKSREVVPRSWKQITEDDSYILGRVLHLDCPSLQSYKQALNDSKFTVREFNYDSQAVEDNKAERDSLIEKEKKAKDHAKSTLQMAFSEVFLCHLHLKAVRVFVESVLWYGIPVNFQSMVIQVNERKESGLSQALDKGFADAKGSTAASDSNAEGKEDDDHPFVKFAFDLEFLTASG
jgi:V-type H+-transporting ATPase subunit C